MFLMCLITSDYLENRAKYVNAIIGIMHADDGFRLGSFLSVHYTHAHNTDRYTVINSFCLGACVYEHIVIQNRNNTDLIYLNVVVKKKSKFTENKNCKVDWMLHITSSWNTGHLVWKSDL